MEVWQYSLCGLQHKYGKTEKELLECPGFCERDEASNEQLSYSVVFGESVSDMVRVAKEIRRS